MATLAIRSGKTPGFEIQFFHQGRRKTIYLGGRRYCERTARELLGVVETLIYLADNSIAVCDKKTLAWIEAASDDIRQKLQKAGLVEIPELKTAGELWDTFKAGKRAELAIGAIEEGTMKTYDDAENRFFMFFRRDEELSEITKPRMEQWKDFLRTQTPRTRSEQLGLAESTTAGTISKAKAAFNWAVRTGWITESPLDGVGRGSYVNEETEQFVPMDVYKRLLSVCPCQDWRCILALVRIGGLRAPSEVLRLRWDDIDFENALPRFRVTSSKTKRYAGKGSRIVPLWPALAEELSKLFCRQADGAEYVISRYRRPSQNLGTQFARIVKMAGVGEISRPFDNMRASRSMEVYASDGAICESAWIGHSMKTAKEHYLRVREEDFARTLGTSISPTMPSGVSEDDFARTLDQNAGKNEPKSDFPAPEKNSLRYSLHQ